MSTRETTAGFAGAEHTGSGSFVSYSAPSVARATLSADGGGYELNLVNAPVAETANAVLGDALGVSYVVDPRVQGSATLQTSSLASREALADIPESALAVNGAGSVRQGGRRQGRVGRIPSSTQAGRTNRLTSLHPRSSGSKILWFTS